MTTDQFDRLCALLPHRASWGDSLTPAIVQGICDAVAAQPQAEPVAWAMPRADGLLLDVICPDEHEAYAGEYTVPLYLHHAPPMPTQCAQASEVDMRPGECWISLEAQALRARDLGDAAPVTGGASGVPFEDAQSAVINRVLNRLKPSNQHAAQPAPVAAVPPGYVLVPVEPTEAMVVAGCLATDPAGFIEDIYKAMIAAAPTQPDHTARVREMVPPVALTPLTDAEITQLMPSGEYMMTPGELRDFARATIAKFCEVNGIKQGGQT